MPYHHGQVAFEWGTVYGGSEYFSLNKYISHTIARYLQAQLDSKEDLWLKHFFRDDETFDPTSRMSKQDSILRIMYKIIEESSSYRNVNIYECPYCYRLHVQRLDSPNQLSSYVPETPCVSIFTHNAT